MTGILPYLAIALIAIAGTTGGIVYLTNNADDGGYNRALSEVVGNENKDLKASIKDINDAFSKIQIHEDELGNLEDGPAAPVLSSALDGVRSRNQNAVKSGTNSSSSNTGK